MARHTDTHPLAAHMRRLKLTQGALARATGVPQPYISQVLNRKRVRFGAEVAERINRRFPSIPVLDLIRQSRRGH